MAIIYKTDLETANAEFEKICDDWFIDIDENNMKDDDKIDFRDTKRKIIRSIQLGLLCRNEDNTLTYTISKLSEGFEGEELQIKRPKGSAGLDTDQYKDHKLVHKVFSYMSAMTGKPPSFFSKLDFSMDVQNLQAIISLFFGG